VVGRCGRSSCGSGGVVVVRFMRGREVCGK